MIISFNHIFIFVAVPKTVGHAIRRVLRPLLGPHDWEQCGLFEKKSFPQAEIAKIGHGHLSIRKGEALIPPAIRKSFQSFAVFRDPIERFVSAVIFMHRSRTIPDSDTPKKLKAIASDDKRLKHFLLQPQVSFITDEAGSVGVTHLMKYETLQSDFDAVCAAIGLPQLSLPKVNVTKRKHHAQYVDDELEGQLRDIYAADYALADAHFG